MPRRRTHRPRGRASGAAQGDSAGGGFAMTHLDLAGTFRAGRVYRATTASGQSKARRDCRPVCGAGAGRPSRPFVGREGNRPQNPEAKPDEPGRPFCLPCLRPPAATTANRRAASRRPFGCKSSQSQRRREIRVLPTRIRWERKTALMPKPSSVAASGSCFCGSALPRIEATEEPLQASPSLATIGPVGASPVPSSYLTTCPPARFNMTIERT